MAMISVRDQILLEVALKENSPLSIPEECQSNSRVIKKILGYVPRAIPEFAKLSDAELKVISDSTAYLLRPDTLLTNPLDMEDLYSIRPTIQFGKRPTEVAFRNNPDDIFPNCMLEDTLEGWAVGGEFFRCYNAVMTWGDAMTRKVTDKGSQFLAYTMADVTGYLLIPDYLEPYTYTPEELAKYYKRIKGSLGEDR